MGPSGGYERRAYDPEARRRNTMSSGITQEHGSYITVGQENSTPIDLYY